MPDLDPRSAVREALLRRCTLPPEYRLAVDVLLRQADQSADPEARREMLDTVAGMLTGTVGGTARRRGRPRKAVEKKEPEPADNGTH